mgnify:CR=1 FL=1
MSAGGFAGAVKKVMGAWQYDDTDIRRLSTIMTLHDIGFSVEEVEAYMRLLLEGEYTTAQRLSMLEKKRSAALEEIHFKERQLQRWIICAMRSGRHKVIRNKMILLPLCTLEV